MLALWSVVPVKLPSIPNPLCAMWGHDFVTRYGKTYCLHCGKVVK